MDFSIGSRVAYGSWSDALRGLIEQAENAGRQRAHQAGKEALLLLPWVR